MNRTTDVCGINHFRRRLDPNATAEQRAESQAIAEAYWTAKRRIGFAVQITRPHSSIIIHTYPSGEAQVFAQDFDSDPNRPWTSDARTIAITPELRAEFDAAIEAAQNALRVASGRPDARLTGYGWHVNTQFQSIRERNAVLNLRRLARKRKAVANAKAKIDRLHDEEGWKWERAVVYVLSQSRLPDAIKEDIAGDPDWRLWLEAY